MKAVIALLLGVAAAEWDGEYTLDDIQEMDTVQVFREWAFDFGRVYKDVEEESMRFMKFLDNLYYCGASNSQDLTYKLGLNQFSDMDNEEFQRFVFGESGSCINHDTFPTLDYEEETFYPEPVQAPASLDWTTKGVVTPVKNQGSCGSCWAFSATGALECEYAINQGKLNNLAEQQMVDCAGSKYGCAGCNGGQMTGAIRYAADAGGQCLTSAYPYTARNGNCKASTCGTKYDHPKALKGVTKYSEPALVTATAVGCVSIGIQAGQPAFQNYKSGVLTGTCGTSINHGVLVVGYGNAGSQGDYWKVKNSWGTSWGDKGYILICRNCNKNGNKGECGILCEPNMASW